MYTNFKMATQIVMEDVTDPDEPGASGGNVSMQSLGQDSLALAQSPPSKRAEQEEADTRQHVWKEKRRKPAV